MNHNKRLKNKNSLNTPILKTEKTHKTDMQEELKQMTSEYENLGLSNKQVSIKSEEDIFINCLEIRSVTQLFSIIGIYITKKYPNLFKNIDITLQSLDQDTYFEGYVGKMLILPFISSFIALIFILFNIVYGVFYLGFLSYVLLPIIFITTFSFLYYNPFRLRAAKRLNINSNLPFALNHLAAIASSGAPPEKAFEILSIFTEFGAISKESSKIIDRIHFGEDITTAIKHVMRITPSEKFKGLLAGILTVIETGGDLEEYLKQAAETAMHNYKLAQNQYTDSLSTYADIYTAILIAAPLFMVSILAVMNIIPSTKLVGGISIPFALTVGVYIVMPVLNILFILLIDMMQPEI
ncbi:MAG: type II secretion system F family protein [DPANN group archaeon]|nr:type II secretion system F family protein [DPANN group archaeon]